ncbi:hypothetical protein [Cytobacillus sp.]
MMIGGFEIQDGAFTGSGVYRIHRILEILSFRACDDEEEGAA